jgi:hypothetical protein
MRKFERRLRVLEARMITDPVVLHLADGSTRTFCAGREFLVSILQRVCRGAAFSPGQSAELALIRQCMGSKEPGGGRLAELMRCMLHAQAAARENL